MATNPSLTSSSNKPASKDQVKRVRTLTTEAAEGALEDNAFTHDELQIVHTNGGEYKAAFAENFIAFLRAFSRKLRGIVTPKRAEETGLMPQNWTVKEDRPESEVDLSRIDYDYCPVREGEPYIEFDTLLIRAAEEHAIGSLGLAADLIQAQKDGKEIFPVESRGKVVYVMPLTILLVGVRPRFRRVACFFWDGFRWVLGFSWGVGGYFGSDVRLLRLRESVQAAVETSTSASA